MPRVLIHPQLLERLLCAQSTSEDARDSENSDLTVFLPSPPTLLGVWGGIKFALVFSRLPCAASWCNERMCQVTGVDCEEDRCY